MDFGACMRDLDAEEQLKFGKAKSYMEIFDCVRVVSSPTPKLLKGEMYIFLNVLKCVPVLSDTVN